MSNPTSFSRAFGSDLRPLSLQYTNNLTGVLDSSRLTVETPSLRVDTPFYSNTFEPSISVPMPADRSSLGNITELDGLGAITEPPQGFYDPSGIHAVGTRRNADVDPSFVSTLRTSVGRTFGPGFGIYGYSGHQTPESVRDFGMVGSQRHADHSRQALDFDVIGPLSSPLVSEVPGNPYGPELGKVTDEKALEQFAVEHAAANRQASIGLGRGYMTDTHGLFGRMHVDNVGPLASWGRGSIRAGMNPVTAARIDAARLYGFALPGAVPGLPRETPIPTPRPDYSMNLAPIEQAPPVSQINDNRTRSITPDSLLEYVAQPDSYIPPAAERATVSATPATSLAASLSATGLDQNGFISAPVTPTPSHQPGSGPITPSDNYSMLSTPVTDPHPNFSPDYTAPGTYQRSAPAISVVQSSALPNSGMPLADQYASYGLGRYVDPIDRPADAFTTVEAVPSTVTPQQQRDAYHQYGHSLMAEGLNRLGPNVAPPSGTQTQKEAVDANRSILAGFAPAIVGGLIGGVPGLVAGMALGNRGRGILGSFSENIQNGGLSGPFSGMQAPGQWMGGNFAQNDAFSTNSNSAIDPNTGWQSFTNKHGVTTLTGGLKAFPEDAQPMVSNAGIGGGVGPGKG